MSDGLDRVLEQTRQQRDRRARAVSERLEQATAKTSALDGPLTVGARVFDTVTGEEGEVVHVARENIIVPTA